MGKGMWLRSHRYAAVEKRRKPFKEVSSRCLGHLLKAVPEAPVLGTFRFCLDLGRQMDFLAGHNLLCPASGQTWS